MLCQALSVARQEKHKEIQSPSLLLSPCWSVVLQLRLFHAAGAWQFQGMANCQYLCPDLLLQHNMPPMVFFHSITFCQQRYWLLQTRHFEGGVVVVAVDKQVNEDVIKMPFHQCKFGNQLQKPFPIPV